MASTGKIFSDSSNIYQDKARLLFNYYEQAAEQIVKQEEAIEKQISDLEAYRQEIEIKKSDIGNGSSPSSLSSCTSSVRSNMKNRFGNR